MATFRWIENGHKANKREAGKFVVCDGLSRTVSSVNGDFDTYDKAAEYLEQMREADDDNKS